MYYKNLEGCGSLTLEKIIETIMENWQISIAVAVISVFIIFRVSKTMSMYLGAKKYAKKSRKLRRKKHNGLLLVDKIKKKRKKNTNSYNKLKGRGKSLVKKYLAFKMVELHMITKFSYGKLLKRSNDKLIIFVKNEKKIVKKISKKKGVKDLINLTNKYSCLNETIQFLHNLSEAILEQQEYEIYLSEQQLTMGYMIK